MKTRQLRKRHRNHSSVRNRAGLTLMEVMLVLVILGILGSMAAMFISGAQKDATRKATKTEIDTLVSAIERYHISMLNYPSSQDGLRALIEQPSNDQSNRWANSGPFIKPNNDLKDPWGNDYIYEVNPQNGTFTISSPGPDGSADTEDDVTSDDQF